MAVDYEKLRKKAKKRDEEKQKKGRIRILSFYV